MVRPIRNMALWLLDHLALSAPLRRSLPLPLDTGAEGSYDAKPSLPSALIGRIACRVCSRLLSSSEDCSLSLNERVRRLEQHESDCPINCCSTPSHPRAMMRLSLPPSWSVKLPNRRGTAWVAGTNWAGYEIGCARFNKALVGWKR